MTYFNSELEDFCRIMIIFLCIYHSSIYKVYPNFHLWILKRILCIWIYFYSVKFLRDYIVMSTFYVNTGKYIYHGSGQRLQVVVFTPLNWFATWRTKQRWPWTLRLSLRMTEYMRIACLVLYIRWLKETVQWGLVTNVFIASGLKSSIAIETTEFLSFW